ncbi:hypothetical protein F2Q70_00043644 [Brassica cretica]|uniref:RNase H type-1 domain-containing protein n=1 Tax=Brassica cretica TaxID=69181 RepID=A0A8S9KBI5_BRACR|nr:hypothetical protein F2Q70_00043644 [Brassica cretica]
MIQSLAISPTYRRDTFCWSHTKNVDGSWTSTDQFSGIGWVWKDSMRNIQLMETQNLRRLETSLHSKLEVLRWAMESMLQHSTCQRFETDCKDLIAMIADP